MKYAFTLMIAVLFGQILRAKEIDLDKLDYYEEALWDVMEIIGEEQVIQKLESVEESWRKKPSLLNAVRRGLIYHEVALNLTFFDETKQYSGYAQRSYDVLTTLVNKDSIQPVLRLYIDTYRASALALMSAETKKLSFLGEAFNLFEEVVQQYGAVSPRPEFMRGSVAENLPKMFWRKRKWARIDFESIIQKAEQNPNYADFKIMSFTYWAWANAHPQKKYRAQALAYLDKAIQLDPNHEAGRERAEALKTKYGQ